MSILLEAAAAAFAISPDVKGTISASAVRASSNPAAQPHSDWRLVRTPNPRGGEDAVSIMHTPDPFRSDPDFAGVMVRCSDRGIEVLVILLQAFSLRARPQVAVSGGGAAVARFTGTIAAPGTAILLPAEARALVDGPWQK